MNAGAVLKNVTIEYAQLPRNTVQILPTILGDNTKMFLLDDYFITE